MPPRRLTYSPEYDFGGRGPGRVAALAKWLKIFDFSRVWSFAIASYVKIDQKTNFAFGQSQIRKQLCFMNWGKIVHRLDFNNDSTGFSWLEAGVAASRAGSTGFSWLGAGAAASCAGSTGFSWLGAGAVASCAGSTGRVRSEFKLSGLLAQT